MSLPGEALCRPPRPDSWHALLGAAAVALDAARRMVAPVPAPVRVALLIVFLGLVWWQLGPALVSLLSRLAICVTPRVAAALVLPEYLLSSWLRDQGRRPLPGTYGYGSVVETCARAVSDVASVLGSHLGRRRPVRWRALSVLAAVPIVVFLIRASLPASAAAAPAATFIDGVQAPWLSVDGWLMAGSAKPTVASASQASKAVQPTGTAACAKAAPTPRPR